MYLIFGKWLSENFLGLKWISKTLHFRLWIQTIWFECVCLRIKKTEFLSNGNQIFKLSIVYSYFKISVNSFSAFLILATKWSNTYHKWKSIHWISFIFDSGKARDGSKLEIPQSNKLICYCLIQKSFEPMANWGNFMKGTFAKFKNFVHSKPQMIWKINKLSSPASQNWF